MQIQFNYDLENTNTNLLYEKYLKAKDYFLQDGVEVVNQLSEKWLNYWKSINPKYITFPKNEWKNIKKRLSQSKSVFSLRVGEYLGKFKTGDVCKTGWGKLVKIKKVKRLKSIKEYKFYDQLTPGMLNQLKKYKTHEADELEIIKLHKQVI